jgi:hypothetical protein
VAEALARVLGTPWAALGLGAVGVGLGVAILFVGAADAQATVFRTPAFVTWIILYIGQIALWVMLAPSAWSAALKAGHTFGPIRWTGLGIGLTLLLMALFLPSAISPRLPGLPITNGRGDCHLMLFLDALVWRIISTVVIALLVLIAPSVAEIWIVQEAVSRAGLTAPTQGGAEAEKNWAPSISLYLEARGHLQAALLRLGLAISALTVVTAQLRNAEVAYIDPGASGSAADAIFPNAYVLLYGLYFTCLVALIYLSLLPRRWLRPARGFAANW